MIASSVILRAKAQALATTSALAIIMSSLAGAQAAQAQTAQNQTAQNQTAQAVVDEIVVTGSRIVRDGYEAPTPVSVLGADQLNAMANTNIADAVRQLPVFSNAVAGRTATANLTSGAAGVNLLNLRGMGAQRTLVLLDGKRVINASLSNNFTGVDVNSMPHGLVNRVDVVTGGASAAYGSDALSGVVNFVTDKEFTGVKGLVEGGVTTYGDDKNYLINLAVGTPFAGGRGHFMAFGETHYNEGIQGNTRSWNSEGGSVVNNPNYTATNGQPFYIVARQVGVSTGTPGGLITSGPLKGIYFGPGGQPLGQFNFGQVTGSNTHVGGDWQISRIDNGLDIDPELSRQAAFVRLSYDLTDSVNAWAEWQWASSHSNANSNPNRTLANVRINSGNPFIPASVQAQMTSLGLTQFILGSTNGDVPRFHSNNRRTLRRVAAGVNGSFDAAGTLWAWDAHYQISTQGLSSRADSVGLRPRLALAHDAVLAPNGSIVCRIKLTDPSHPCIPYNPMGLGVNSQGAIDYSFGTSFRYDSLRQDAAAANLSGEPFELWAGPVSLALGIEHRYERVRSINTPDDEAQNFLTGNYRNNLGNYSVTEGYVETVVPLARDMAWAQSLEVNAAIRATDYSTSGYVTTWKVGATWQITDDIRFRGTRSRDIRAPYLGELFAGGTAASGATFFDPTNGTTTTSGFSLSSGNPTLGPEKADTTGLGIVVSPQFLPGFQASVDYYSIDIGNATQVPNAQSIINACYAGSPELCSNIIRVNGIIDTVIVSPQNIARQLQKGIDVEASYRLRLEEVVDSWAGDLTIRALGTFVTKLRSIDVQRGDVNGRGVVGGFGGSGFAGLTAPKFRSHVSANYDLHPISVTVTWRHVGSGVYNNAFTECTSGCPTGNRTINNNHIDSNNVWDFAIKYKFLPDNDDTEVFLTIQNVLNAPPPFIGGTVGSTYYAGQANTQYDRLGRIFLAGVRFRL